jgi:hypothetical protein
VSKDSQAFRAAFCAIEDDLMFLEGVAAVCHMIYDIELRRSGEKDQVTQSAVFAARTIEEVCNRIERTLLGEIEAQEGDTP